jgi:nitroreductase
MSTVMDFLLQHRSIRQYLEKPVREEDLLALLEIAMAVPADCKNQSWEFVVITDPEVLDQLWQNLKFNKYNAPAAIAICRSPDASDDEPSQEFRLQDYNAAVENVLMAAAQMGLSAMWVEIYPIPLLVEIVSKILELPSEAAPLCLVFLGYLENEFPLRAHLDERRIHWQKYLRNHLPHPENSDDPLK